MGTIQKLLALCALSAAFMGCGGDETETASKASLTAPDIVDPGKADRLGDEITMRGRLSFGVEAFGEYDHDGQNEGYVLTGEAGAVLTLENTHKGTTRNLDTNLFLYGPADADGFYGVAPIVSDDDGGYGYHARIKHFTLPARGEYLVIMGTYMGIDRGRYRLLMTCGGDECVVPCDDTCASDDVCSGQICDDTDGCLSAPLPISCHDLTGEPGVLVSETELEMVEGGRDTFTVRLTGEPTADVTIWVESSDLDEAMLYPQKLLFCAPGREETSNGCRDLAEGVVRDAPHWRREIEVAVMGVNDAVDDDEMFEINVRVVSEDSEYAALAPTSLLGINMEGGHAPDYSELGELTDDALLGALHAMLRGHTAYGYLGQNSARTILFSAIELHDGLVSSIYTSDRVRDPLDATNAYQMGFNVEHTWPQAQFDKLEPMKSDLHHIFPTDTKSNASRASYDYGMTSWYDFEGSRLGLTAGEGSNKVYQARSERRGDIARAHFYMVARYKHDHDIGVTFDDKNLIDDGCITRLEEAVLRRWHEEDPVSDEERIRNNRVEAYQGNRNPFIDMPELVGRIQDF